MHSPTASAFSLFDDLLILREGRLVYAGECGAAAEYFATEVGLRPLEMGESLPEWLVDAMSPHAEVDAQFLTEKTKALVAKRARGRAQVRVSVRVSVRVRGGLGFGLGLGLGFA